MKSDFLINIILPLIIIWLFIIYAIGFLPLRTWAAQLTAQLNTGIDHYKPQFKGPLIRLLAALWGFIFMICIITVGANGAYWYIYSTKYVLNQGTLELWTKSP